MRTGNRGDSGSIPATVKHFSKNYLSFWIQVKLNLLKLKFFLKIFFRREAHDCWYQPTGHYSKANERSDQIKYEEIVKNESSSIKPVESKDRSS